MYTNYKSIKILYTYIEHYIEGIMLIAYSVK